MQTMLCNSFCTFTCGNLVSLPGLCTYLSKCMHMLKHGLGTSCIVLSMMRYMEPNEKPEQALKEIWCSLCTILYRYLSDKLLPRTQQYIILKKTSQQKPKPGSLYETQQKRPCGMCQEFANNALIYFNGIIYTVLFAPSRMRAWILWYEWSQI